MTAADDRKIWFETFLVVEPLRGSTREFPIDMLRYATCLPADEPDSRVVESRDLVGDGLRDRRVVLRRFSTDGEVSMAADGVEEHPRTGVKRWHAFGWDVVCHVATREEAEAFRYVATREQAEAFRAASSVEPRRGGP